MFNVLSTYNADDKRKRKWSGVMKIESLRTDNYSRVQLQKNYKKF